MQIKILSLSEIPEALALTWEVFLEFEAPEYPAEGVAAFRGFLDNPAELARLTFYGAFRDKTLVGILAMRGNHIGLFFVRKACHRQGVGKALFAYMRAETAGPLTVHSSPYAVEIYRKLGFTPTAPEQLENGIRYIPMTRPS